MNYKITDFSSYSNEILTLNTSGTVHSVYNRTINLMIGEQLLSLQAVNTPFSPITLQTDIPKHLFHELPVYPGVPVSIDPKQIIIGQMQNEPVSFSLLSSRILDCRIQTFLSEDKLIFLRTMIRRAILASDTNGFVNIFKETHTSESPFFLDYARKMIKLAKEQIVSDETDSASITLSRLVGLGTGLTPCGDDFLCGVFAGLNMIQKVKPDYSKFETTLKCIIKEKVTNTNDISRSFLNCAILGQFSQAVLELNKDIKESNIFESFHEIGHSSGMDTLCGIFFVLELLDI